MFPSRHLSQNFITNPSLAKKLVSLANIHKSDNVLEIGSGQGILTAELVLRCGQLTAIEIDPNLANSLEHKLSHKPNLQVINQDFLSTQLPTSNYKVFANIPFYITADILRRLLFNQTPPTECYLVMQKEAYQKFAATPYSTKVSVLLYPFFCFQQIWQFKKSDFTPKATVETVMVKITKRSTPLISSSEEIHYKQFISYAFGKWKQNLKITFKDFFTYKQWKRLAKEQNFNIKATASQITSSQWLSIYKFFQFTKNIDKTKCV
jgi:16S rRNA A1518/A1519 N6-dimethyltransferase RsmA/KsgA/DIM1 with predicted DNA glycosylase/AP lyase activity